MLVQKVCTEKVEEWPRLISTCDETPDLFKFSIIPSFQDSLTPPYTVYLPEESSGSSKIIQLIDNRVIIYLVRKGDIKTITLKLEDISYIEYGTIFLSSWIKLYGKTKDEMDFFFDIRFNAIGDNLLKPIIERIRKCQRETYSIISESKTSMDYLKAINLKLLNFSKASIMPGETILHSVYQPDIKRGSMTLGAKHKLPASVAILTNSELVMVSEGTKGSYNSSNNGGIWTYISLGSIKEIKLENDGIDLLVLRILLKDGKEVSSVYTYSNKDSLINMIGLIQK